MPDSILSDAERTLLRELGVDELTGEQAGARLVVSLLAVTRDSVS